METIKILGVDPSLRNTGLAIVEYNAETGKFSVPHHCQTIVNPQKYKGKDAILSMLDLMQEQAYEIAEYLQADTVIVESPPIMFNKNFSSSVVSAIAHVAGGAAVIFGLEKVQLLRPGDWNKSRKKEVMHAKTTALLGDYSKWDFARQLKNEKHIEHILDAVSMAIFWIKSNYIDDDEEELA